MSFPAADDPRRIALLETIEAREDELVDLARALVRIPTVNPPGEDYRPCAELIGQRLAQRGFEVSYVRGEGAPGDSDRYPRWNVIARKTFGPGPCVHFNGHIDVVLPGEGWTVDPFALSEQDGRLYGRGTADMKGYLASVLAAVPLFCSRQLVWPVHLAFSYDEEVGCLGVRPMLGELAQRQRLADPLRPARHAGEGKHETGHQNVRQEE